MVSFAIMLGAIPALIVLNQIVLAKVLGVLLVVSVSIALRFWLIRANRQRAFQSSVGISANDRWVLSTFKDYNSSSGSEKKSLEKRLGFILAQWIVHDWDRIASSKDDLITLAFVLQLSLTENEELKAGIHVYFDEFSTISSFKSNENQELIQISVIEMEQLRLSLKTQTVSELGFVPEILKNLKKK